MAITSSCSDELAGSWSYCVVSHLVPIQESFHHQRCPPGNRFSETFAITMGQQTQTKYALTRDLVLTTKKKNLIDK